MFVYILNTDLEVQLVIDDYYSLSWAERHYEAGEFELELPITYNGHEALVDDYYVVIPVSDVTMLIKTLQPSSSEDRRSLFVRGESAESLLKRRWTSSKIDVGGSVTNIIKGIVFDHLIDPWDSDRKMYTIDDTMYGADPNPGDTYYDQFDISSIYDICVTICKATGYGFRFYRGNGELEFEVVKSVDRSNDVIFSDGFDNVISSSYIDSSRTAYNVCNVVSDDLVHSLIDVWLPGVSEPTGTDRKEVTIETTIDRDLDEGYTLTDSEVYAILQSRGRAKLYENQIKGMFEGDFDIYGQFKLGVDFFLGDVVKAILEGRTTNARITEVLRTYSPEEQLTHVTLDFIDI